MVCAACVCVSDNQLLKNILLFQASSTHGVSIIGRCEVHHHQPMLWADYRKNVLNNKLFGRLVAGSASVNGYSTEAKLEFAANNCLFVCF